MLEDERNRQVGMILAKLAEISNSHREFYLEIPRYLHSLTLKQLKWFKQEKGYSIPSNANFATHVEKITNAYLATLLEGGIDISEEDLENLAKSRDSTYKRRKEFPQCGKLFYALKGQPVSEEDSFVRDGLYLWIRDTSHPEMIEQYKGWVVWTEEDLKNLYND